MLYLRRFEETFGARQTRQWLWRADYQTRLVAVHACAAGLSLEPAIEPRHDSIGLYAPLERTQSGGASLGITRGFLPRELRGIEGDAEGKGQVEVALQALLQAIQGNGH